MRREKKVLEQKLRSKQKGTKSTLHYSNHGALPHVVMQVQAAQALLGGDRGLVGNVSLSFSLVTAHVWSLKMGDWRRFLVQS